MCDTFVALPSATADGSVIFGKNSDREPNEAQVLEFYPAREYNAGEMVHCTYLTIPQVLRTNAVLLSRPFWMWGAEIGANDSGVVIGNEAVWTKMPLQKNGRLTGMDLLRLGLERSDSAQQAVEIITDLLQEYGQGGPCGFEDKGLTYHNSFLITDQKEAWVLETAGSLWAALKVKDVYSISNGLTIGEAFDLSHPDLVENARKKGWLKKGKTFHFARCYSDWFYTTFSSCKKRQSRSFQLVNSRGNGLDVPKAFQILRDHGSEDYYPDSHFLMNHVCAHSANTLSRHATQSTASLVAHLKASGNTFWATGTSAPCTSVFKPIRFGHKVLPGGSFASTGIFNRKSSWWTHELLHRSILEDYPSRIQSIREERNALESSFQQESEQVAPDDHFSVTQKAFRSVLETEDRWHKLIRGIPIQKKSRLSYRLYWKKQNRKAGIPMDFR